MKKIDDPFRAHRERAGVLVNNFQGEDVPMILGYKELRKAAKDWETYSSDAPFRVPIPSEENVRSIRQLPIETNPPDHTEYRKLVEPFFRRPTQPEVAEKIKALIHEMVQTALASDTVEIVRGFCLPLQSRALTYLLDVPESEAEEWIGWGVHVFRDGDNGAEKGAVLEEYIVRRLDEARRNPGTDYFSTLVQGTFQGRPLTQEEIMGLVNLTFAGGRDTIITAVSSVIAYFGDHPEALASLKDDPKKRIMAVEEFVRVVSPLTHIGRVCPRETMVQGVPVKPLGRVSLCWASANRDETMFDAPDEIRLDRAPNPHVGFGSGVHNCLGATHARSILRSLLEVLCDTVGRIELLEVVPHIEKEAEYERTTGFDRLVIRMHPTS